MCKKKSCFLSLSRADLDFSHSCHPEWELETERRDQKFEAANFGVYSSLSDDSIVFAGWQGREASGSACTSCLLSSSAPVSILTVGARALVLPLSSQSGDGVGSTLVYLSLEKSQSIPLAQLVQRSFLQTHLSSIFSDVPASSP